MSTVATLQSPGSVGPKKRWTIAEFDRLVIDGYLREGSRTYLWDSEIIEPMPENPPHVNATMNLLGLLTARLPVADWTINLDKPLVLREGYKPQPDLTVLNGPRSKYRSTTPTATDVALLVEVSDTTYADDSGDFLRQYAAAGIPQYWVVNITGRRVEVYAFASLKDDGSSIYTVRQDYGLEESVPLNITLRGESLRFEEVRVIEIPRDSI